MEFIVQLLFPLPLVITWASAQASNDKTSVQSSFLPPYCPKLCGNISIDYPFGVGVGCFRQGFDLSCDNSSSPPKLFKGNERTYQVTRINDGNMDLATGITIIPSNVKNYTFTWTVPNNGPYSLDDLNSVIIIGCGVTVKLTYAKGLTGQCAIFCDTESLRAANGSSCNSIGCCEIFFPDTLTSYTLELQRYAGLNNLSKIYDVKAFASSDDYTFMSDDVYTSSRFSRKTRVNVVLDWKIPYPLTCEAAKKQESTYACLAKQSECYNATDSGYQCSCLSNNGNAYIPDGCQSTFSFLSSNLSFNSQQQSFKYQPVLGASMKVHNLDIIH